MGNFERRYSPDWIGVVDLIEDWARKNNDEFLTVLARGFTPLVENHYSSSEGCPACSGEIEHCGPWADAQNLMLAWLISKVDL